MGNDLSQALAASFASSNTGARLVLGSVTEKTDGTLAVSVGGKELPVSYLVGVTMTPGQCVAMLVDQAKNGDSTALVIGTTNTKPTPGYGAVISPRKGAEKIPVITNEAGRIEAYYLASYTPANGDIVELAHTARGYVALGKSSRPFSFPANILPEETHVEDHGKIRARPTQTGTWRDGAGGWDTYIGPTPIQGSYGRFTGYIGCFHYGHALTEATGKNITEIRLRLGARRRMGNHGTPLNLTIAAHNQPTQTGKPTPITNNTTLTIPPYADPTWHTLPQQWAQTLANGGGLMLYGPEYGGIDGIDTDPESGLLELTW